jgi:glutamate synthase (NADPH/NADH) large chain
VGSAYWEQVLRDLVEQHVAQTNSRYGAMLLHDWPRVIGRFWQIVPKEYVKYLAQPLMELPAAASA